MWLETKYRNVFTGVNPTPDRAHRDNVASELNETFPEDVVPEMWLVDALFTHPHYQRKGIGRGLLQWPLQRGREEHVPVGVKGSPVGGLAYRACGFQSVGATRFGRWFDELQYGGEVHQFWLWEPEGSTERWVERTRERRLQALAERPGRDRKGEGEGEGDPGMA
jgi:GNAT superfamily N-acetyltransferase